jgi:hypothetical protein
MDKRYFYIIEATNKETELRKHTLNDHAAKVLHMMSLERWWSADVQQTCGTCASAPPLWGKQLSPLQQQLVFLPTLTVLQWR